MAKNLFKYDPVIGYRFVPHLKGRVRHEGGGYLVRANSDGFRNDRDFLPTQRPGTRRIMFFGDSNTAGDGVSNGKRFSDVVEQLLPDVESYNFGLPSSGVDQQYLAFTSCGAQLACDLLVLCPMVDNIRRNLQDARLIHSGMSGELALLPKPYFTLTDGALTLHNSPVPKGHRPVPEDGRDFSTEPVHPLRAFARDAMARANARFPGLRSWSQRMRRMALPAEYNSPNHPGWLLMREILMRWINEARAPVVLMPIPTFDHISGAFRSDPFRARFAELSRDAGVPFIDIMPELLALTEAERASLRFPNDEHPTVQGHERLGQIMAPHLAKHLTEATPATYKMSAE